MQPNFSLPDIPDFLLDNQPRLKRNEEKEPEPLILEGHPLSALTEGLGFGEKREPLHDPDLLSPSVRANPDTSMKFAVPYLIDTFFLLFFFLLCGAVLLALAHKSIWTLSAKELFLFLKKGGLLLPIALLFMLETVCYFLLTKKLLGTSLGWLICGSCESQDHP